MAKLSTHVLDTAAGKPATGVRIVLFHVTATERRQCGSAVTNKDGRTDEPLLSGDSIATGVYELVFEAGEYFKRYGIDLPNPPFLDEVVIRFGISDGSGAYHVPLLLSPYGYTTYRGS